MLNLMLKRMITANKRKDYHLENWLFTSYLSLLLILVLVCLTFINRLIDYNQQVNRDIKVYKRFVVMGNCCIPEHNIDKL